MHLLSAHLIPYTLKDEDFAEFDRIKPRSAKIINSFDMVRRLYNLSPRTLYVLRDHPLSEQHEDMWHDPEGTGKRHADEWADKLRRLKLPVPAEQLLVLGINEPAVWDDPDPRKRNTPWAKGVEVATAYNVAFLNRLKAHGIRGGALNMSVGWPANDGPERPPVWTPFEPVRDAILEGGHVLFVHEYWPHTGPLQHVGWYAGRILKCGWNVPIIIGECGMEERVVNPLIHPNKYGWRGWMSAGDYMGQLWQYHDIMSKDPRIHSLQVYTWGWSPPWHSLDVSGEVVRRWPTNDAWDNAMPSKPPKTPGHAAPVQDPMTRHIARMAQQHQKIQFNPSAALQKRIFADGFVPNSPEFDATWQGTVYRCQRAEHLGTGEVRVYVAKVPEWHRVWWFPGIKEA